MKPWMVGAVFMLGACGGDDDTFDEARLREYIADNAVVGASEDDIELLIDSTRELCDGDASQRDLQIRIDPRTVDLLAAACPATLDTDD